MDDEVKGITQMTGDYGQKNDHSIDALPTQTKHFHGQVGLAEQVGPLEEPERSFAEFL